MEGAARTAVLAVLIGASGACNVESPTPAASSGPVNGPVSASTASTNALRADVTGSGSVTSSPSGINCWAAGCSASFSASTQVTLTAAPSAGHSFTAWGGDCAGSGATCTVSMAAARTVTASFAVSTGPVVVSSQKIGQLWGAGVWAPATHQITGVQAGDAIFVLGLYWITPVMGVSPAPSDNNGTLLAAVNQAPAYGGTYPPVAAQIYYELNAAAGNHTITPPDLGGGGGDGELYIVLVRGLGAGASLVATGNSHATGTAIPSTSVNLSSSAVAGDFVVAIGGYDNTQAFANAGLSDAPAGWSSLGVQNNATSNVPSEACYRLAPSTGNQAVTWTWADPNANVVTAAIAAFH